MDSRKSMRHFYCKDSLWETFENMATDFSVSVDYLINEAMRYYAKNKGYQVGERSITQPPSDGGTLPVTVELSQLALSSSPKRPPLPPLPHITTDTARSKRPSGNFSLSDPFMDSGTNTATMTLFILFEGEKIPVTKEQFIIGRVSRLCDLTIKDANVSRKHAAIIRRNNNYYIKDLGSTNGIEYNGMRIDNKRIDEGDTFHICDHVLTFTFK